MTTCFFAITSGLSGLYMPNSAAVYCATRRRDLIDAIRSEVEFQGFPASAMRQIKWRDVWHHAKRHGTSSLHFSIDHGDYEIAFHGLTEAEYNAQNIDD